MSGNPKHTKFVSPPHSVPHSMTQREESYVERWHMRKKELSMLLMQHKTYMLSPKIMRNYTSFDHKNYKNLLY